MNSDGSCRGNSNGGRGVVRDSLSKCIMTFILPLGEETNNTVEIKAFLFALKWCIENGHNMIVTETDSLLLKNCISENWSMPWNIRETIKDIKLFIHGNNVIIEHCFREANKATDKLASLSHCTDTVKVINNTSSLPRHVKGLLNMDRWQFPSFRVRRRKLGVIYFDPP
ncbi:uncharacterized protein LOC132630347 [Lycium barbarum]|uniref:uncharacterized protein LOC132630347 n=1 Tax=Lycium barbarum TaxID=112863 RepID=UPI00293F66EA|nr:uncharacterized protein LOC132630347 [Lycium barbarum]